MAVNQFFVPLGGESPPLRLVPDTPTSVPRTKTKKQGLKKLVRKAARIWQG
jgi:hypothetical protein